MSPFQFERLWPRDQDIKRAVGGHELAGKTSLALWLGWQSGTPVIHLDLLLTQTGEVTWRLPDLERLIAARESVGGAILIEGVMVLDALKHVQREADLTILVDNTDNE